MGRTWKRVGQLPREDAAALRVFLGKLAVVCRSANFDGLLFYPTVQKECVSAMSSRSFTLCVPVDTRVRYGSVGSLSRRSSVSADAAMPGCRQHGVP